MSKQFYLISLKHTSKGDSALTFWGANGGGYTWDISRAGVYDEEGVAKHTSPHYPDTVARPKEDVDKFWQEAVDFNDKYVSVPNTKQVQYHLGLDTSLMKPKKYSTCRMKFCNETPVEIK